MLVELASSRQTKDQVLCVSTSVIHMNTKKKKTLGSGGLRAKVM